MYQRLIEQIRWFGVRRVVTSALAAFVLAVGAWWVVRVPPAPVESGISFTGTSLVRDQSSSSGVAPALALNIVVHVAGEVNKPGVYTLPNSARMIDAVTAAGGATARADLEVINLATPLIDSSQIYVPAKGVAARPTIVRPQPGVNGVASATNSPSASGVVNINRASVTELDTLPGVGPSTAQAIVDYRSANGPFGSPEDLLNVKGIGPAKFEAMRKLVGVLMLVYNAPSTTVLMASDSNAPTQMPIANGRTSCSHSGQPVTALRVARNAEICPTANHSTMLKKNASTYAEFEETAGTPSIGKTGKAMSRSKKPSRPNSEPGSATSSKPTKEIASDAPTAIRPPRWRTCVR